MKKLYALVGAVLVAGMAQAQLNQVPSAHAVEAAAKEGKATRSQHYAVPANRAVHFSEDFESGTFPPTGWTVMSGAASTITVPAEQAWHEEANGNPGNCVSVLYNNSADVHDEWIMTPAIAVPNPGSALRLEFQINTSQFWHVTPNDNADIKCYVSTASGSITDLLAGTEIFWEQDPAIVNDWATFEWYTYQADFTAFQGQTIYLGWHYDGQDGAQFNLDNISIYDVPNNDLEARKSFVTDVDNDWEIRTYDNLQVRPIGITGILYNNGGVAQQNVGFDYMIMNSGGTVVDQGSSSANIASLAPGAADTVIYQTSYTPPTNDEDYTVWIIANSDSVDSNNLNDSTARTFTVTQDELGAENGPIDGGITNISGGTGLPFSIGIQFIASADASSTGAWLPIGPNAGTMSGELAYVALYEFDTNASDFIYVGQTDDYTLTGNDAGQYVFLGWSGGSTFSITNGNQYLLVAGHYGGATDVEIGTSGSSIEGQVLGYDNANSLFQLLDPPTPGVRLSKMPISVEENALAAFLGQSQPNPAAESVRIPFELAQGGQVSLEVFDITGKKVMDVQRGSQSAGPNNFNLYVGDLEAGVYTYTLTVDGKQQSKQMIIAR